MLANKVLQLLLFGSQKVNKSRNDKLVLSFLICSIVALQHPRRILHIMGTTGGESRLLLARPGKFMVLAIGVPFYH